MANFVNICVSNFAGTDIFTNTGKTRLIGKVEYEGQIFLSHVSGAALGAGRLFETLIQVCRHQGLDEKALIWGHLQGEIMQDLLMLSKAVMRRESLIAAFERRGYTYGVLPMPGSDHEAEADALDAQLRGLDEYLEILPNRIEGAIKAALGITKTVGMSGRRDWWRAGKTVSAFGREFRLNHIHLIHISSARKLNQLEEGADFLTAEMVVVAAYEAALAGRFPADGECFVKIGWAEELAQPVEEAQPTEQEEEANEAAVYDRRKYAARRPPKPRV